MRRELKRILAKAEPADGDREPVMLLFGNIDLANDECDFGASPLPVTAARRRCAAPGPRSHVRAWCPRPLVAFWCRWCHRWPGMGLELGLDLWGFSLTYTGPATRFLGLAYSLLRRPGFGRIVVAHSEARDRQQLSELAGDGE